MMCAVIISVIFCSSMALLLLLLLLLTLSHFSASVCWETFTYPRLSVALGSIRGRKFILLPKVKRHVLGICILYDTYVIVLLFATLFGCLWLNLYTLDI